MNRREFAKQSCVLCFGAMLGAVALESCASIPAVTIKEKKSIIEVSPTSFAESSLLRVKTMFLDYDILLVKDANSAKDESQVYHAVYLRCSHQDQPLSVMSDGLVCNSHGSRFSFQGAVQKEPAIQPLTKFKTELKNGSIIIHIDEKAS